MKRVSITLIIAVLTGLLAAKLFPKTTFQKEVYALPEEIAFINSLVALKNKVDADSAIINSHIRTRLGLDLNTNINYDTQRGVYTFVR